MSIYDKDGVQKVPYKNTTPLVKQYSQEELDLQRFNNPFNQPIGHFTGRCGRCGSKDLWEDNLTYGCNCCKTIYVIG